MLRRVTGHWMRAMSIPVILYIVAFVLFLLAACNVPSRLGLGWLGAAFAMLAYLIASGAVHR